MSRKFATSIDLAKNELQNAVIQQLASDPSSPVQGQFYYNTTSDVIRYYDGAAWVTVGTGTGSGDVTQASASAGAGRMKVSQGANKAITDYSGGVGLVKSDVNGVVSPAASGTDYAPATSGTSALKGNGSGGFGNAILNDVGAPTADFSMGSHKLTNVTDPTSAQDGATKNYVDLTVQGISWKASVRAASTANGTLASAYENGDTLDGVTLVTGDRILLKNQTTASENGIYTVNASGAPTRVTDADTGAEMAQAAVFVREGTTNAESAWVCSNDGTITLGSTNLTFVQFSTAGGVQAATTSTAGIVTLATQVEAEAKSNTNKAVVPADLVNFPIKKAFNVGDGSSTSIALTHSLGTRDVTVEVYDAATFDTVECDVVRTSTSVVTLGFTSAPASNAYRAVIIG